MGGYGTQTNFVIIKILSDNLTLNLKQYKKMNPAVHFEMPAEDRNRMADFYSKVYGWEAQFFGEEMGNYVTVSTSETDENGMIRKPGAINDGFYPKSENIPSNCPSLVIAVDYVKEYKKKL